MDCKWDEDIEIWFTFCRVSIREKVEYNNRERNGDVIANYDVNFILFHVGNVLPNTAQTLSCKSKSDDVKASYYRQYAICNFEKILSRFEYWQRELGMDKMWRVYKIDANQIDNIYSYISSAEKDLGTCYQHLPGQEVALVHWDRAIIYVRNFLK